MSARRLRVPDGPPLRLDRFLAEALGFSRRSVQEELAAGKIRIDGRRARKGDAVAGGAEIVVEIEPRPETLEPEPDLAIPILHEDEALVAVDKPAGMPSHAVRADDRGTVANVLVAHFPGIDRASERPLDAGLVHRLDGGTSGVLLAARTRVDWIEVRRQFGAREVRKAYVARVAGELAGERTVAMPIAADRGDRRRVRVGDSPDARDAITHVRAIGRSGAESVVEVEIETGMRHQIRAHLAAIGHPVVGDELYGGPPAERVWLHAREIEIRHPRSGRRLRIESPLPPLFVSPR
jgi:23S rRNA pseudouridine1911/1915/1917 synthase